LKTIRIIKPYATVGLDNDCFVYKDFFNKFYPEEYYVYISDSSIKLTKKDDIHLYVSNTKYELTQMASIRLFMINHELFSQKDADLDVLKNIDYVLCRTNISVEWARQIKEKNNLSYKIIYTKFTSLFPIIKVNKIQNLILHSAGEHHWKQTDSIIQAWMTYPDLPSIVITCSDQCYDNIKNILKGKLIPKNMILYNKLLDKKKFELIKNEIGIHLCPSIVEGYGHYINEARKIRSLVVTSDYPPMNELVDAESGVLIKCSSFGKKKNGAILCIIDKEHIYEGVKKTINLSLEARDVMIERSYEKYVDDTNFFIAVMKELISAL